jgi:hypothetical protein
MRKKAFAIAVILAAVAAARAGDVWKTKPFDQWTEKDIQEILQTSPWAKAGVQPQGAWHPDGMSQATGTTGIPGSSTDNSHVSAGATTDKPGGTEKQDAAAAAQATYSVFWWSSRTIRAASMRRAVLKGSMTEADAEKTVANVPDDYMILVQGTNMQVFQHRGEEAFAKEAYIQLKKNKQKLSPTKVSFLKGSDGQTVTGAVFYFAKKTAAGEPTIAPDEKEIDFYLQVGDSRLLTYFDPKKMVDAKGEDL